MEEIFKDLVYDWIGMSPDESGRPCGCEGPLTSQYNGPACSMLGKELQQYALCARHETIPQRQTEEAAGV
ncbi:MAG TPA: hypothetical protein VHN12_00260 [Geobacteraceae bacterium]|nr:hypothetical protein [Geobacteraceae bacterium]